MFVWNIFIFIAWDVLLSGRFVFGMLWLRTFSSWDILLIGTFCLGTFGRCRIVWKSVTQQRMRNITAGSFTVYGNVLFYPVIKKKLLITRPTLKHALPSCCDYTVVWWIIKSIPCQPYSVFGCTKNSDYSTYTVYSEQGKGTIIRT